MPNDHFIHTMPKQTNGSQAVWVDLLCLGSLAKLFILLRRYPTVTEVYYFNAVKGFEKIIPFLEKNLKKAFRQVNDFIESEEKIGAVSVHEYIQTQLAYALDLWLQEPAQDRHCRSFCETHDFSPEKFKAHLKESAFPYMLRPVQVFVYAQKRSGPENAVFILRQTPLSRFLKAHLGAHRTFFYNDLPLLMSRVQSRPDYLYDAALEKTYYANRFVPIVKIVCRWICDLLLYCVNRKKAMIPEGRGANIALEITQSRVRQDEINDVFWLRDSGIDPRSVCGFEYENFDEESIRVIEQLGIRRYQYARGMGNVWKSIKNQARPSGANFLLPSFDYFGKMMPVLLQLVYPALFWTEKGWLKKEEIFYYSRTMFWASIYKRLGIRLVWTMYDMDPDKLPKGEAVKMVGGLYAGGHWSNNPLYRVDNQKCFDVVFTWGPHFLKSNFSFYPYLDIFSVGYPSDHYFKNYRTWAAALKAQYPGKFILSYHDNSAAHDIPTNHGMNIRIHQVLIALLHKYVQLIVFLKPKRKFEFEKVLKELPELQSLIKEGRIKVFLGDTPRTKAVPAAIGLASDLAVGLCISTAAAECFFAGTVALHADLTDFINNDFSRQGKGTIIFSDLSSLQTAIENRILGRNTLSHEEYRKYYEALDPFQDGQAYRRTGFLIQKMQEGLERGLSREDAVVFARKEYEAFLEIFAKSEADGPDVANVSER